VLFDDINHEEGDDVDDQGDANVNAGADAVVQNQPVPNDLLQIASNNAFINLFTTMLAQQQQLIQAVINLRAVFQQSKK